MATTIVRAVRPHDCPDTCAMLAAVQDGVAAEVRGDADHPATAGAPCAKVLKCRERTHHKDRLLHPMGRIGKKGKGKFVPATWNDTLESIASRLKIIAARDAEQILPYSYASTLGFGPQIDALVVYNANSMAVAADSAKVAQEFARDDLFTFVLAHFQTDTMDYTDILLRATTRLEHLDVHMAHGRL